LPDCAVTDRNRSAPYTEPARHAPDRDGERTQVSIGATLSAARRRSGLSLADVTAVTRVREPVIEAMERDDFSGCGGDFYARAHIRSVAKAVGADPGPLIAEYDEQSGRPAPPAAHEIFEPDVMPARAGGINWSVALAVALLLVVGYALVALFGGGSAGPADEIAAAPVSPAAADPTSAARPRSAPKAPIPGDRVEIRLTVTDQSWVKATGVDGTPLFQGLLEKGDRRVFRHGEGVRLVVGNAAGVRLNVNGYDLGSPGGKGGVLRATYRPGPPDRPTGSS
jgi:cytoskeleton protein RodZ